MFSNDVHAIVFVCLIFEKPTWVWKWTAMRYDEVVVSLTFVCFYIVLVSLFVYILAVISNIICLPFILFSLFNNTGRGYGRVLQKATAASAEDCMLWYSAKNCWQTFFEIVLCYRYLEFIAMHIIIPLFSLYFIIWHNIVSLYVLKILVKWRDINSWSSGYHHNWTMVYKVLKYQ